jgi:hypothetical protein
MRLVFKPSPPLLFYFVRRLSVVCCTAGYCTTKHRVSKQFLYQFSQNYPPGCASSYLFALHSTTMCIHINHLALQHLCGFWHPTCSKSAGCPLSWVPRVQGPGVASARAISQPADLDLSFQGDAIKFQARPRRARWSN